MKLITYDRVPWPETSEIKSDPISIFIARNKELRIERGDTVGEVAAVVAEELDLDPDETRRIVALWFAMGNVDRRSRQGRGLSWS